MDSSVTEMQRKTSATDVGDPEYFHKVVDCQWACPAHTPVPEYIRLIAQRRFTDAYMLNWESNVFPGILGRVCDRPCEPACRRGRIEEKPVAICRLKRVAADYRDDISTRLPEIPSEGNGKRIALLGAGPASLTVARDLLPLGYACTLFDKDPKAGGLMRTNIPSFRLPEKVLDEEVYRIVDFGVEPRFGEEITSLKAVLDEDYDAVFVGTGAPKGKDLAVEGRKECKDNIQIGISFLTSVAFGHVDKIGERVVVIGGGNTAMDCCRTALRIGGKDVRVTVRSPRKDMKASDWEIEEAEQEGIPIYDNHSPKAFVRENGKFKGVLFEVMQAEYDENGKRKLVATGEEVLFECDDVLIAIGQDNAFDWIERDLGLEFENWGMPQVDKTTMMSTLPGVFFGGDSAWGPENIIVAVAHGHQAAISIDLHCRGEDLVQNRPAPGHSLISQKMGIHEWAYENDYANTGRIDVPHEDLAKSLKDLKVEVELGYDDQLAFEEAERCLNCDVQTVFTEPLCIECDACMDICPIDCINFIENAPEPELRQSLRVPALNTDQALYVSQPLKTGRIMAKDEDLCVHCGLCAERCPTGAWDMQKFTYVKTQAAKPCQRHLDAYVRWSETG